MNSALARQRLELLPSVASACRLCPRECGVNRLKGEIGFCGAGQEAEIFLEYVHWGEDADITPAQTMYLTGCNLSCVFCQTAEESQCLPSVRLTPEMFKNILVQGRRSGAEFVNILGGEPTVNMPALLELFARSGDFSGLVWNTNFYGSARAFQLLDGLVDVFMGDLKFGDPACAKTLSGAEDAGETARARALEIYGRTPDRLIARHLVLPGHFDCCTRPTLEWIARNLPGVRVSLKTVYLPPRSLPQDCEEKRFLSPEEAATARRLAEKLCLNLTRDADLSSEQTCKERPDSARPPVLVEAAIAPDGRVYMRHIVREAAQLLSRLESAHE